MLCIYLVHTLEHTHIGVHTLEYVVVMEVLLSIGFACEGDDMSVCTQ